jgi:type I restriction enzyme S subunit
MKTQIEIRDIFSKSNRLDWTTIKFGDIAHEVKETSTNPLSEGIERAVGLEHLSPLDIHIRTWGDVKDGITFTRKFKSGQILFGRRRAYQRKAALAEFDGVCSGDIIVMEANKDRIEPDLLPFLVHSDKFFNWAVSTSAGSLSPRTKFKDLAELEFQIPPRPVQKKLAAILWTIDKLESRYRDQHDNLLKTQNALASELIEQPKDVDFTKLGEVVVIEKGLTYSSSDYTDSSKGIPMINLNCFEKLGGFSPEGVKYYGGDYKSKHLVNPGDVIIAVTDITRNGDVIGYPVILPKLGDKVVMSMDCCKLIPDSKRLISNFLYYLLKTNWAHKYLYVHSNGTTVLHLDMKSLPNLKLPNLSLNSQREIAERLNDFDSALIQTTETLLDVKNLRQTILNNSV